MNPAVILLLCAISYANADQRVALEDPKFSTLGRHFTGTPSLLLSLATKEEVIHMLLSNFQSELRANPKNEAAQNDFSYSDDDQLDLVDRWEIHGPNPNSITHCIQLPAKRTNVIVYRYLKDYDETSGKVSSEYVKQKSPLRPQYVAWNPIAAYHMMRRFSKDLKALLQSMNLADEVHLRKLWY